MSVDRAILVQTAGKIAGELVASMHMDSRINTKETKTTKGGRKIPVISQDEIQIRLNQKLQAGSAVSSTLANF